MIFDFATASRILFGCGRRQDLAAEVSQLGRRALIVCGRDPRRIEFLRESPEGAGLFHDVLCIPGEPTIDVIQAGVEQARKANVQVVVAVGGGSPIDAGKAIAALVANDGELLDYLEVIGAGQPLKQKGLPFVAVPTTAGAGAEVTKNAVIKSTEHQVKVSLRHPSMLADCVIVDPELTVSLPPLVTAATGMDALTQLIEPFVCKKATPMTDSFCREGLARVGRSLKRAVECGSDLSARTDMCLGALLGGLALANSGLGAVHGFAGPIGGRYEAPHGAVCAGLLPHVTRVNLDSLADEATSNSVRSRYDEVARLLIGDRAKADDLTSFLGELAAGLNIPALRSFGLKERAADEVVEKTVAAVNAVLI